MPFLSVIIPVYGVQGYLRECLDSLLDQSWQDLEIIAVDDSSTDHSSRILTEYEQRDSRIRVIRLENNVGNGHARNIGLDAATGKYVWFVDGDDWVAPGAVRAVVTALRRDSPHVLLVDHSRVDPFGRHSRGNGAPVPGRPGGADGIVGTILDEPRLLNVFTVAWNKIVEREFLMDSGIRFDVGWYEDIPFTYPLLVAAQRIATLRRVCYHYRRRRQDAITATPGDRHFEVFDQWSRVFDRLDRMAHRTEDGSSIDHRWAGADGVAWRAAAVRVDVFHRMVGHLRVVLAMRDRLPASSKRAFFHKMSRHFHWYRPLGYVEPARPLERLRHRLIAADAYWSFQQLRKARLLVTKSRRYAISAGRLARRGAGTTFRRTQATLGIALYHLLRLLPVDPRLAVYAAYWYRGYACNPAAVYEKARELAPHVHGVWVVNRRDADNMPADVSYVVDGSLRYYRTMARARWLVNNVNFPDFVMKRPGTTYLQTHHGTPVKVMGVDQSAYPVAAQRMDLDGLLRRSDRWDYSVSSNAHSTEVWSRAYPCPYETLEHGYPRNDRLARAAQPDGAADVADTRQRLGLPEEATVVLYAPTHREYAEGFSPLLDVEHFARSVGPDVVVLQRAHYFYAQQFGLGGEQPGGEQGGGEKGGGDQDRGEQGGGDRVGVPADERSAGIRDVSQYPVVEDLMVAADVLITDYSSVMFDYAVLDRPEVIFAPDWDSYVRMRGVTFDLLAQPPGVVATNQDELVEAFRNGTVWDKDATNARAEFRARFTYLDDGHTSERVVRTVFSTELESQLQPGLDDELDRELDESMSNPEDPEFARRG